MSREITLDWWEAVLTFDVARRRHASSWPHYYAGATAPEDLRWWRHVQSTGSEQSVAKAIHGYWTASVDTTEVPDVIAPGGLAIEVRWRSSATSDLCLREIDKDRSVYALVTGFLPTFRVVGFMVGGEGKRDEWRGTSGDRPVWYVPQAALRPVLNGVEVPT